MRDMEAANISVYDYTPDQAVLVRAYELRTVAAISREAHGRRAKALRTRLAVLDTLSTFTSSRAFVSLALWKTAVGSEVLLGLVFAVALMGIIRSSFRLSESAEQYSRLMNSWAELSPTQLLAA